MWLVMMASDGDGDGEMAVRMKKNLDGSGGLDLDGETYLEGERDIMLFDLKFHRKSAAGANSDAATQNIPLTRGVHEQRQAVSIPTVNNLDTNQREVFHANG